MTPFPELDQITLYGWDGKIGVKKTPTIRRIVRAVADASRVSAKQILGDARQRDIVHARYVALTLIHRHTGKTDYNIAQTLNKDATTISHARESYERLKHYYPYMRRWFVESESMFWEKY